MDKYLRIQKYIASNDPSNFTVDIPTKETLDSRINTGLQDLANNVLDVLGDYVSIAGTQTISGSKTFSSSIRFNSTINLNGSTGTSGYVLTSNGSSAPTWKAPSDTKVTQSSTTSNGSYPVLLGYSTSTSTETNTIKKSSRLTFNPYTGILSAQRFDGNFVTYIPWNVTVYREFGSNIRQDDSFFSLDNYLALKAGNLVFCLLQANNKSIDSSWRVTLPTAANNVILAQANIQYGGIYTGSRGAINANDATDWIVWTGEARSESYLFSIQAFICYLED